ncbi:hypothetical protein [Priestia taiwanensis]|uniref:Uncharacterized protein n=1 Tax=Priestia taiwanensis TaxID=1347902 RepID=A0A917ELV8_9BACI|nr:hypothetical protein [Priestia taiwanensis]MBM7361383.1 hypothetical protein [Priestia taiwanensis]GGE53730.1 hypothetical protein GCM10007140_00060 [Priestia taiwanensis]
MPIIKNIDLFNPHDREKNRKFYLETRCMSLLYRRLLPTLKTEEYRGVFINCLSSIDEIDDPYDDLYLMFDHLTIFIERDMNEYSCLSTNIEKKTYMLDAIQEGMEKAADQLKWDKEILYKVYQQVVDFNYVNEYIYTKKSSPNRKYVCSIICEHDVSHIDVYIQVKKRYGKKVIGKEKIYRTRYTDEEYLFFSFWKSRMDKR